MFSLVFGAAPDSEGHKQPLSAPHVQGVVKALSEEADGQAVEPLRKVEMPQLDRRHGGIVALMNHPSLAQWCSQVTGADWLQVL